MRQVRKKKNILTDMTAAYQTEFLLVSYISYCNSCMVYYYGDLVSSLSYDVGDKRIIAMVKTHL